MNWVDYTILAVLLVFLIHGFARGFARQVVTLVGIVGGLFLAARFGPALADSDAFRSIRDHNYQVARIAAFAAIFLGVALVWGILFAIIGRLFPRRGLRPADSFLGAVIGAVEAVLILGGLSLALMGWNDPRIDPVRQSVLAPRFAEGARTLVSIVPERDRQALEREADRVKRAVEPPAPEVPPPAPAPGPEASPTPPSATPSAAPPGEPSSSTGRRRYF